MRILDTLRHPYSTLAILQWMLHVWSEEPNAPLLVLVEEDDGLSMDDRLRVRLSKIRKGLKYKHGNDYMQFGFHTAIIDWTEASGENKAGLCLNRVVTRRHQILTTLAKIDLGGLAREIKS